MVCVRCTGHADGEIISEGVSDESNEVSAIRETIGNWFPVLPVSWVCVCVRCVGIDSCSENWIDRFIIQREKI